VEKETMISALKTIFAAARRLLKKWRVMAVLSIVYAALLATLWLFIATSEATTWQVLLTLLFAALAPLLFFILQSMIVNYARGEAKVLVLLRRSFRDSCKLALASLPLALVAVLFVYLLNKLQPYAVHIQPAQTAPETWPTHRQLSDSPTHPLQWSLLALTTARFLFFGILLPLAAAHLWSATLRVGLLPAFKKVRHDLPRAFTPEVVLTYTIGLLIFGLVPYLLLFKHTYASRSSVEFGLFIARLLLVFVFTLCGWTLTLDALASKGSANATDVEPLAS
jgi:hypothetical protein